MAVDSMDLHDVGIWKFPILLSMLTLACHSLTGVVFILVVAVMSETRSSIILTRLARKLRKETGNHRYRARAEDERGNFRTLLYTSCTRPLCKYHFNIYRYSRHSS